MLNSELNIIKEIQLNSVFKEFKTELEIVRNSDTKNLIEKEFLIDGKDYYFYPIIVDTEIEVNGGLFMIGFYFPLSDKYFSFILGKGDDSQYIDWIKLELTNIFKFFKTLIFVKTKIDITI